MLCSLLRSLCLSCSGRSRLLLGRCRRFSSGSSTFLKVLELRHIVLAVDNDGNNGAELDVLGSFREEELCDVALLLHLEVDSCLVGLNLSEDIAGLDGVALFLEPLGDVALLYLISS